MECALERKIEESGLLDFEIENSQTCEMPLEAVKKISESWSHKQWGDYLETVDSTLKEDNVFDHEQIENLSASNYAEQVFAISNDESLARFENIKKSLKSLVVHHLSKREQQVIWCRFWESLNTTETARKLNISRSSVRTLEKRACEKMSTGLFKNRFKNSSASKHLSFI